MTAKPERSSTVTPRDLLAHTIQAELLSWLERAASTATSEEDFVDLYAGAIAALSIFLWNHRHPHTSIDQITAKVATDVREFLNQAQNLERGALQ